MRYLISLIMVIIFISNTGCIKHFALPSYIPDHIPDHAKDYRKIKKGELLDSKNSEALIIPPGSKR